MFPLLTKKYALSIFRKIRLLSVTAATAATFVLCLFFSCSEDVIIVNQPDFDPPRFNWRSMDIYNNGFAAMCSFDTSKVFLLNYMSRSLYVVSGGNTVINNFGAYNMTDIKAISNNEVYLFGETDPPEIRLIIIKWNGAGFEYYPTGITVIPGPSLPIKGCVVNSNEIWILSRSGIGRFDGINYTTFAYQNTDLTPIDFYLSKENKIQYIAQKWAQDYIQTCLYEFQDTGFVKIFDYVRYPNINLTYIFLREIGGYKYGLELKRPWGTPWSVCIHNFSDISFSQYFCYNRDVNNTWSTESGNPEGFSTQDFIILVETQEKIFETTRIGILHWNGSRISKELQLNPRLESFPFDRSILYNINPKAYLVLEPRSQIEVNCTLYFGTEK